MEPQARIHYAVTDGGGCSPNVVQSKASVLYMVRSPQVKRRWSYKNGWMISLPELP